MAAHTLVAARDRTALPHGRLGDDGHQERVLRGRVSGIERGEGTQRVRARGGAGVCTRLVRLLANRTRRTRQAPIVLNEQPLAARGLGLLS